MFRFLIDPPEESKYVDALEASAGFVEQPGTNKLVFDWRLAEYLTGLVAQVRVIFLGDGIADDQLTDLRDALVSGNQPGVWLQGN